MAELLELAENDAGAIVTAVEAERVTARTIYRGIPLDTLGATITATVFEVISPLEPGFHPEQGNYGSRLRILASTSPQAEPGSVRHINGQFRGFVGDERIAKQLALAGAKIVIDRDGKGEVTGVRVDQGEVYSWRGTKYFGES